MKANDLLLESFIQKHPKEAAHILEKQDNAHISNFIENIPVELAVELIKHLDRQQTVRCFESLATNRAALIIESLPFNIARIIIKLTEPKLQALIYDQLPDKLARSLRQQTTLSEKLIGAHVERTIITLFDDLTVAEARAHLQSGRSDIPAIVFVTNRDHVYRGFILPHQLFTASANNRIENICRHEIKPVTENTPVKNVLNAEIWQAYFLLPVIDHSGVLTGEIHLKDLSKFAKNRQAAGLSDEAISTGKALAELYRVGLMGILRSAARDNPER